MELTENTSMNYVKSNTGLKKFIMRCYNTTGLSLLGALGVSQILIASGAAFASPGALAFGGLAMSLGGILGTS